MQSLARLRSPGFVRVGCESCAQSVHRYRPVAQQRTQLSGEGGGGDDESESHAGQSIKLSKRTQHEHAWGASRSSQGRDAVHWLQVGERLIDNQYAAIRLQRI